MASEGSRDDWPRGLALVGYRGTGKSTVGRILADRLGWGFEDADEVLERNAGRSIAAIFADEGEAAFRELERETIAELAGGARRVIATGGGAVLRRENREALRAFGFVAWLVARPETIADRLRRDPAGRPALTASGLLDEVGQVLREREDRYREASHAAVETDDRTADEVAGAVLARLIEHVGDPS